MIFLAGCVNTMTQASATEDELCRKWGGALPTRSHSDSSQTKHEIQVSYATFALSCPKWVDLVPLVKK